MKGRERNLSAAEGGTSLQCGQPHRRTRRLGSSLLNLLGVFRQGLEAVERTHPRVEAEPQRLEGILP